MLPLRFVPIALLGIPLAFIAAFFIAPMMSVFLSSILDAKGTYTFAQYLKIVYDEYHWQILTLTVKISLMTTGICIILGYPLAYFLTFVVTNNSIRRLCVVMLVLPLFTSNIVRSFGWIVLLGRRGLVNEGMLASGLTDAPVRFLGTETGILIGLVYIHLPFIVIAVANSLANMDDAFRQAAADLGANKWAVFTTVTLPLSLNGLAAGALMVFALTMSAYVTPALLGAGQITMFSMLIFQQYSSVFDLNFGGALSLSLIHI